MNTEQFTPGPWAPGQSITAARPGRAPGSFERVTIAQRVNRAGDMRLIAAAPDMADALRALINRVEAISGTLPDDERADVLAYAMDTARATLARATGDEQ